MKARLEHVFKSEDEYQIIKEFLGVELKGEEYVPLFPYFAHVSIDMVNFTLKMRPLFSINFIS